jgi:thiamine biosynthesis lipoprotein
VHRIEVSLTRTADYWIERRVRAMGSVAHLVVGDAPDGVCDWALEELERLEQCWSRFRPDSELAHLNARAGEWTEVSGSMLLALGCAATLHSHTHARFDPTIIDALERAGYDCTFEAIAPQRDDAIPAPLAAPGFAAVQIDEAASRVLLPRGTRIDLGGVGKGLAADLVARGLIDRGARSVLVGLGGDLRARGETPLDGWHVPVEDPRDPNRVLFHRDLDNDAIVTSTTRIRTWTRAGRRHHHLIDPATGASSASGVVAVVAAAHDAWWAEGIAKAIVIGGVETAPSLVSEARVRAWLFLDDGTMREIGGDDA